MNHLHNVVEVYKQTGTLWENYAPQSVSRGKPSRGDFVGWTGIGPIEFLIEYVIGIKADAVANVVTWDIRSSKRVGVEKFWFGGKTVSLLSRQPDARQIRRVTALSDGDFRLKIKFNGRTKTIDVPANESVEADI